MTKTHRYRVGLTPRQVAKLRRGNHILLSHDQLGRGLHEVAVNKHKWNRLAKAYNNKKGIKLFLGSGELIIDKENKLAGTAPTSNTFAATSSPTYLDKNLIVQYARKLERDSVANPKGSIRAKRDFEAWISPQNFEPTLKSNLIALSNNKYPSEYEYYQALENLVTGYVRWEDRAHDTIKQWGQKAKELASYLGNHMKQYTSNIKDYFKNSVTNVYNLIAWLMKKFTKHLIELIGKVYKYHTGQDMPPGLDNTLGKAFTNADPTKVPVEKSGSGPVGSAVAGVFGGISLETVIEIAVYYFCKVRVEKYYTNYREWVKTDAKARVDWGLDPIKPNVGESQDKNKGGKYRRGRGGVVPADNNTPTPTPTPSPNNETPQEKKKREAAEKKAKEDADRLAKWKIWTQQDSEWVDNRVFWTLQIISQIISFIIFCFIAYFAPLMAARLRAANPKLNKVLNVVEEIETFYNEETIAAQARAVAARAEAATAEATADALKEAERFADPLSKGFPKWWTNMVTDKTVRRGELYLVDDAGQEVLLSTGEWGATKGRSAGSYVFNKKDLMNSSNWVHAEITEPGKTLIVKDVETGNIIKTVKTGKKGVVPSGQWSQNWWWEKGPSSRSTTVVQGPGSRSTAKAEIKTPDVSAPTVPGGAAVPNVAPSKTGIGFRKKVLRRKQKLYY